MPHRLEVTANEDEELDVRWNARYALLQRENYGAGWLKRIGSQWWRPSDQPRAHERRAMTIRPGSATVADRLPAEAARRGMSVEELAARLRVGALPPDDPLVVSLLSGE